MESNRLVKLWIVDDDSADRELLVEALDEANMPYEIDSFTNGQELCMHLASCDTRKFPNFILLDLNMPVMDGRETLKQIKGSEQYRVIPVFVLSTSNSQNDIQLSYNTGANLFLVKPMHFEELCSIVKSLLSLFRTGVAQIGV